MLTIVRNNYQELNKDSASQLSEDKNYKYICVKDIKKDVYEIKDFMDYNNYGGAVLLGCKKTVVKGHGSSKTNAIYNCVKQAYNMEKNNLTVAISNAIGENNNKENGEN